MNIGWGEDMSYDTSDIKQAIEEYYMREIEDNNLVHKGRASRINSLHHWKENDLKYFEELESKAKAFDEIKGVAFWYFEVMRPNFKNSDEYESFYEVIRNELKEIESEAD